MDEYIKREDALDAVLFALVGTGLQSTAIYAIRDVTTADVVPKSEVDKWIGRCQEWHSVAELKSQRIVELEAELSKAKVEVAIEIFEEIEKILIDSSALPDCARFVDIDKFAELKNKYTEGEAQDG